MAEHVNENVLAEKRKKLVLVVDGNPRDAHTTGMLLQNFGYSVSTVKSAEEALELVLIVKPALIILEFILPGMNGMKSDALSAHARSRGFALSEEVAAYLLTHARRDMSSLVRALDALNRYSLETGRPITVPLLRTALQPQPS